MLVEDAFINVFKGTPPLFHFSKAVVTAAAAAALPALYFDARFLLPHFIPAAAIAAAVLRIP